MVEQLEHRIKNLEQELSVLKQAFVTCSDTLNSISEIDCPDTKDQELQQLRVRMDRITDHVHLSDARKASAA